MADSSIILASKSASRRSLLRNAGVKFRSVDAEADETAIKMAFLADGSQDIADIAMILAQTKATIVSETHPGQWVIGADQVLICDGELFSKPQTIEQAREHLLILSGKTHNLETAVACARQGEIVWSYREAPLLSMRTLSPAFIGRYMSKLGDDVLTTVGGYKLESIGVQLFEKIEGDYFAILGLPLLPLLHFLRQQHLIEN